MEGFRGGREGQGNRGRRRSFSGDRDGNRSDGRNFGGNRSRYDAQREMHKATCSECGKECEVPFKPTEGKPVTAEIATETKNNSKNSIMFQA